MKKLNNKKVYTKKQYNSAIRFEYQKGYNAGAEYAFGYAIWRINLMKVGPFGLW